MKSGRASRTFLRVLLLIYSEQHASLYGVIRQQRGRLLPRKIQNLYFSTLPVEMNLCHILVT